MEGVLGGGSKNASCAITARFDFVAQTWIDAYGSVSKRSRALPPQQVGDAPAHTPRSKRLLPLGVAEPCLPRPPVKRLPEPSDCPPRIASLRLKRLWTKNISARNCISGSGLQVFSGESAFFASFSGGSGKERHKRQGRIRDASVNRTCRRRALAGTSVPRIRPNQDAPSCHKSKPPRRQFRTYTRHRTADVGRGMPVFQLPRTKNAGGIFRAYDFLCFLLRAPPSNLI